MGENPVSVLVTYRCIATDCLFKYPLLKPETELTHDERAAWR